MSMTARTMGSRYLRWVKSEGQARFNLVTSGIAPYPSGELPVELEDVELTGPSFYGYAPLQERLASRCGVGQDRVVAAQGCSMANFLAMATTLSPGDEVLIESPTYEPLVATARYLGGAVKRFERLAADRYDVDPERVSRAITPRTRLTVITNLHNPSGVVVEADRLAELVRLAERTKGALLVDEVYLDALFDRQRPSATELGASVMVTSSLTKVYGLAGLRCGWAVAAPERVEKMWGLQDLLGVIPAHPAERLSVVALDHLEMIGKRARTLLRENQALWSAFVTSRDELEAVETLGTVAFPKLLRGSVPELCRLLAEKYETSVVPGAMFDAPEHVRVGIGGPTEIVREGLDRLGRALDEIARG